ncbi:MAG: Xaa-Pro peptidase family protein [Acidobacteriota bacterium]|nr:Xaa-Pro peptidase family protein [Acidobacteriota bacterium]
MLNEKIPAIQEALAEAGVDGWFFCCFQNNDPVALELLGLTGDILVTRRCYYLIPTRGEPRKLAHRLEPAMLEHLPGETSFYLTWQEHAEALADLVAGHKRLAAQYSQENELPAISRLDAGTAERLRGAGVTLETSAELVQQFAAVWSPEQLESHRRASTHLHRIVLAAFDRVGRTLAAGGIADEHDIQKFILEQFEQNGLWTESPPIVGVNAHSADPHYQPGPDKSSPIRKGDFLLIDLWAKEKPPESIYADICWCGVCATSATDRQTEIFDIDMRARDAALELIQNRYPGDPVRGFEVDDAARRVIEDTGNGKYFIHRTGHSIGIQDHGQGANMDNLETHDTRRLAPMTGFSIEPGIYFEGDFGVRTEINIALTPEGVEVTGGDKQTELLRLLA